MYKVIITTVLDPDVKNKLSAHSKKTYIPYSKLIEYSLNDFEPKLKTSKSHVLEYSDFDRIKTQSFTCSIPQELNDRLMKISKELEISKRMLVREIVTGFVKSLGE